MKSVRNSNLIVNISKIEYCRADLIESESPINNLGTQKIVPLGTTDSNNKWHNLYFTSKTAKFIQKAASNKSGYFYKQKLNCTVPGFDLENTDEQTQEFPYGVSRALSYALILKLTTCDNQVLILGRKESPTRIKSNTSISVKTSNNKLTFERISKEPINLQDLNL